MLMQTLGLSHALTSLMWLCGPIAGILVQPVVGLYSDQCRSRFGRRRPYILPGCIIICIAVIVIAFSSDLGYALGDTKEDCSVYTGPRWKAALIFVSGFWVLDFANNAVQGPTRALMADISGQHGCDTANAIFACWMAVGNIMGYSSGSTGKWHIWFPFLQSRACCEACANLKGAFLFAVILLLTCLSVTLTLATEVPLSQMPDKAGEPPARFFDIFKSIKNLPKGMPQTLFITACTWLSWFPFILYDTDWMGREVFHGNPAGNPAEINAYERGVRTGAFGLLLNSIVLLVGGFLIEPLCRKVTPRIVWIAGNFMVFLAMAAIAIVSVWSLNSFKVGVQDYITANGEIRSVALLIFAFLGFPLAILYSVPFAVASTIAQSEGGGQGLCIGVLNISIVVPQVIIALGAGPWDSLFGKGNLPAFALAAALALTGGVLGFFILPKVQVEE